MHLSNGYMLVNVESVLFVEIENLIGGTPYDTKGSDQRITYWYRKTLEGLKYFTRYLEPSVCWNIFC